MLSEVSEGSQQINFRTGGRSGLPCHGARMAQALLVLLALTVPRMCAFARDEHAPAGPEHGTGAKDAQAQQEIQTVYDRQNAALMRRDVKGFLALCTLDYKDVKRDTKTGKGRIIPAGMIRQTLPRQLARYSDFTMTATINAFARQGNQANATATRHVELTLSDPRTGQKRPYRSDTRTRDVWIKTAQGWQTKSSEEIAYKKRS